MTKKIALIIGASSEIGKALALKLAAVGHFQVWAVSRNIDFYEQQSIANIKAIKINDYEQSTIKQSCQQFKIEDSQITRIFVCNGILHNQFCSPEKRLEAFNADSFNEVINANTLTPMLWLQSLLPLINQANPCKFVAFSARVGSINDNHLGGWYSYRASKAALNMLLKTAAIELARRAKHIKLISFHPGTTDTPLSKPFQQNVPEGKLFTPDFVAQQIIEVSDAAPLDGKLSYLDWQGDIIPW